MKLKLLVNKLLEKLRLSFVKGAAVDRKEFLEIAESGMGVAARKVPSLSYLAESAAFALRLDAQENGCDDSFVADLEKNEIHLISHLYANIQSDWFAAALNHLKGWRIIAVGSPGHPSVYRLACDSEGRLIDVGGYKSLEHLRIRFGIDNLTFVGNDVNSDEGLDSDSLFDIFSCMLYLPYEPFIGMRDELMIRVQQVLFLRSS